MRHQLQNAADLGESHTHQVAEVPICSVSASAFSLVASRPTPKIPPTTGTVITHSSKFVIWLGLYTVRP
jgi:hypothetical protein